MGTVTSLRGTATVTRVPPQTPPPVLPLTFRDSLFSGDRIATGARSFARISLGIFATVTVCERSALTLTEDDDSNASVLTLDTGRIHLDVVKARMEPGHSVKIKTPDTVVDVPDAIVIADVASRMPNSIAGDGMRSQFLVMHGHVDVTSMDPTGRPGPASFSIFPPRDERTKITMASPPRPSSQLGLPEQVCSIALPAP